VLVTVNIVENKNRFEPRWKLIDGPLEIDTINGASQPEVGPAEFVARRIGLLVVFGVFLERNFGMLLPAKLHQNDVRGHPVQPGREAGFSAKCLDLAVRLEESLLSQIFGFRRVSHHPETEGIDTSAVGLIESFERRGIALLSQLNDLGQGQTVKIQLLICFQAGSVSPFAAVSPIRVRHLPRRQVRGHLKFGRAFQKIYSVFL